MGVTATQVARAATSAGFKQVIQDLEMHAEVTPNDVMLWGNLREPFLVGGVICLVNSVNERDLSLLNS